MLCLSVCQRHCMSWYTRIHFPQQNYPSRSGYGPLLCSSWTSAHIAARGQPSKPHHGNQLYFSCHDKQAASPSGSSLLLLQGTGNTKYRWCSNASHFSRSRQATRVRVEVDSPATADLCLFIADGCISPSFVSFTSTASLPRFSLLFLLYAQPVYPMTEGRVSSAAPLCIQGSAGSARGRKAVSELWSCAVVVVAVSSRRNPAGFSEATLHIWLPCCPKASPTQRYRGCHGLGNHWDCL